MGNAVKGAPLRSARKMLDCGQIPPAELVGATVSKSWERSLHAGLLPFGAPVLAEHLPAQRLRDAVEQRRDLLARARPVMDYLYAQVRGSGSMVILADENGVLIEALGDSEFVERAARVALKPGASWHERNRGTNAIGTAIAEGRAVLVHGAEHFFESNRFLTCAAAPVTGPDGRLLGVIDISGHHRARHPHTTGLVSAASHMIENRIFELRHEDAVKLRMHPQAEGIGTLAEGLVALADDGRIIGANHAALALLGLRADDIGQALVGHALSLDMADVQDIAHSRSDGLHPAVSRAGRPLCIRIEAGRPKPAMRSPETPRPLPLRDALAELDTGDEKMRLVVERARKVAGKPIPILLQGESGAGKERVAAAIHASGPRKDAPFIAVNCAALPEHLIESELFGYAPGAFTGARREGSPGRIREANGGTLFLDEIGDMPLALQCRLLRVLQEREVVPLGGGKPFKVDFALIAASHKPLKAEVEAGRFRADLYYRLNGLTLALPPLRARSDFAAIVARMLAAFEPDGRIALAPDVATALMAYRWPGNLRQLSNALLFACAVLDPGETTIGWCHLPDDLIEDLREQGSGDGASRALSLEETGDWSVVARLNGVAMTRPDAIGAAVSLRALSDTAIEHAVLASDGNMSEAARRLGISRNTLYRRLKACPRPRPKTPRDTSLQ